MCELSIKKPVVVSVLINECAREDEFNKVSFCDEFKAAFIRKVMITRGFSQFFFSSDNLIRNSEERRAGPCKQEQFSREAARAEPEGRIVWFVNNMVQQGNVAKNNNPENNFPIKITLGSKAKLPLLTFQ